ncbi:MAG TPA: UMP kinase [Alphaproteobacteria bacterium]|nr:UMP kinase [Alphaproteobacteria bacterium]
MRYKRVMLKLSGGAIAGRSKDIFDDQAIEHIVREIVAIRDLGTEIAIVIGGGNIFRGNVADKWRIERAEADNIGMLGTVINGVMLRAALQAKCDYEVRVMSAVPIPSMAEPYIRLKAQRHLEKGSIVVLVGGIGQPFVTTDYPSVQRSIELRCQALLAAKHGVDGVYTADPKKDESAKRYRTLAFEDVIRHDLRAMDQGALLLARDHGLPVHVFDFDRADCMKRIVLGEDVGTYIDNKTNSTLAAE